MNSRDSGRPAVVRQAWEQAKSHADQRCVRCGYPVPDPVKGCKGPCHNCRFLYPAGDCSD